MNLNAHFFFLVFFALLLSAKVAASSSSSPDIERVKVKLWSAMDAKDLPTIQSIASLDPEIAIPALSSGLRFPTVEEATDEEKFVLLELRRMKGLADYFRTRIAKLLAEPGAQYNTRKDFQLLAWIASDEAVSAVAPFLFDASTPITIDSDHSVSAVRWQAASSLTKMRIADAPVQRKSFELQEEDMEKWKRWVKAKGYVPKDLEVWPQKSLPDPSDSKRVFSQAGRRSEAEAHWAVGGLDKRSGADHTPLAPLAPAGSDWRPLVISISVALLSLAFVQLYRKKAGK